ncbi:hypothetical protein GCM10022243_00230 [Saccharothrix violaceirubra]
MRVPTSAAPISAAVTPDPAARWSRNRPAWARSASAVRPDRTHGTAPCGSGRPVSSAGGGSATITWALVPPMPKDDTPAISGRSARGHGARSVFTRSFPASMSGLGVVW